MLSNTTYILQTVFYQHSLKKCIKFVTKVYNIFNLELLFTGNIPRGVFCEQSSQKTRELRREIMQSMISRRNSRVFCELCSQKHLAERYQ